MHTTKSPPAQHSYPIFIVRDFRHPAFGPHEKAVLFALTSRMQAVDSPVFPSVPTLAGDAGVNEKTARRIVHWLETIGVLVEVASPSMSRAFLVNFEKLLGLPVDLPKRLATGNSLRPPHQGGVAPREGGGGPCQGGDPSPPGSLSKKEEKSEEKSQVTTRVSQSASLAPETTATTTTLERLIAATADDPSATITPDVQRIIDVLTSTPSLLASCGSTDPADVAHKLHRAAGGKVDVPRRLASLAVAIRSKGYVPGYAWLITTIADDADRMRAQSKPTIRQLPTLIPSTHADAHRYS